VAKQPGLRTETDNCAMMPTMAATPDELDVIVVHSYNDARWIGRPCAASTLTD
jgi:hypothetical protein